MRLFNMEFARILIELGEPVGFAVLVDFGTGKSCITPEPEQFEFLSVPIHDRLDEIKNAI
jgi:hypothetical protein